MRESAQKESKASLTESLEAFRGIIFVYYLQRGNTMNDRSYRSIEELNWYHNIVFQEHNFFFLFIRKMHHFTHRTMLSSFIAMAKTNESEFEFLIYATYSPDLAPSITELEKKTSVRKDLSTFNMGNWRFMPILRSSRILPINRVYKLLDITENKISN